MRNTVCDRSRPEVMQIKSNASGFARLQPGKQQFSRLSQYDGRDIAIDFYERVGRKFQHLASLII